MIIDVPCIVCGTVFPVEIARKGHPKEYCCVSCRRIAEACATIERELPARPGALLYIMEKIECVQVSRSDLTDDVVRRIRAASFSVGSSGRRLAPFSSGRYPKSRKKK